MRRSKKKQKKQSQNPKIKNNIPLKTVSLFRGIIKRVTPPPKLFVSQWADEYRILSDESSSEPGKWKTERTPYLKEPMDAVGDPNVKQIVLMFSSQVGKTEVLLNILGYYIHHVPTSIMYVLPQLDSAERFSKTRLAMMIRDTPVLKDKIKDAKSRDSGNTILHKQFAGGYLIIAGSNSAAGLCMMPIEILLCDEADRFADSAGTEGDPILLAEQRTTTYWNAKKVYVSTPTNKGESRIEELYEDSTCELWHLSCPGCKESQPLTWEQIREENGNITHECLYCKAKHSELEWKKGKGKWVAQNPGHEVRGFHLNALISPWKTWEDIVKAHKKAKKGGIEKLKVWTNTTLGQTWEVEGDSVDDNYLLKRREYYKDELPDGVLILTAAVDIQADRLETEVVGWGLGKESWGIEYKTIYGDPKQKAIWNQLDDYLLKKWCYSDKTQLGISCACVDSGYLANEVYDFCQPREYRRIFPIKGKFGPIPLIGKPSRSNRRNAALFPIGVDTGKEILMSSLRVMKEGPSFCHFPMQQEKGYDETYFKGLTSEKRVMEHKNGAVIYKWIKKSGARNEPLDLRNYNQAALEILNPNLDLLAKRLRSNSYQQSPYNNKKRRRIISKGIKV